MHTRDYYLQMISHTAAKTSIRLDGQGILIQKTRATHITRRIKHALLEWMVLHQYWSTDIATDTIAERAGARKEEVDAFVWSTTGKKLSSIRKELRIEDAKAMLIDKPGLSAAEVGRTLGFKDKSDFRRQFMEAEECSPAEWKRRTYVNGTDKNRCPSLDKIWSWLNSTDLKNSGRGRGLWS